MRLAGRKRPQSHPTASDGDRPGEQCSRVEDAVFKVHAAVLVLSAVLFLVIPVPESGAQETTPDRPSAGAWMKLSGLNGESTDEVHSDWIEVSSLEWGASGTQNPAVHSVRRCAGFRSGELVVGDLTLTRYSDASSSQLVLACTEGRHFPGMVVEIATSQSEVGRYIRYDLQDAMITSYSIETSGDRPTESFSFDYAKAESSAIPAAQRGKLDPTWDVENSEP
jgi:type VI secretion system secreted protein Hcp